MFKFVKSLIIGLSCMVFIMSSATLLAHAQTATSNCVVTEIGNAGGKPQLPSQCLCSGGEAGGATSGSSNTSEPSNNYKHVTYNGKTVNARTLEMINTANRLAKGMGVPTPFDLYQGSYHPGVEASSHTHDRGGVIDVVTNNLGSQQNINNAVKALRMAGFAAWYRNTMSPQHIHAAAIGDKELHPEAADQITSYLAGGDGLAGSGKDNAPASVGRPLPDWAKKYGKGTAPKGSSNCPSGGSEGAISGPAIQAAIDLAKKQVGKNYILGTPTRNWASLDPSKGKTPSTFDCSGLTGWAFYWATKGKITLQGQTSADWSNPGKNLQKFQDKSKLQPGDLIYFGNPSPYHTAIYIGNGDMIHASNPRSGVKKAPLSEMAQDFIGFLRPMVK